MKFPDIANALKDIQVRICNLLSTLLQNNSLSMATQTGLVYLSSVEDIGQIGDEIERLLACEQLPPSLRVSTLLRLASLATQNHLYELSEEYISKSEALLDDSDHIMHDMDIEFLRISRPSGNADSRVQRLKTLHEKAQSLRFPAFDIQCLRLLADIGFEVGGEGQDLAIVANLVSAKIAYSTGSQLLCFQLQMGLLGRLNLKSTAFGKVLEAEALLASKMATNVPSLRYLLCTVLGNAYGRIGDAELSLRYSKLALDSASLTHSVQFISAAKGNYLNALSNSQITKVSIYEKREAYIDAINADRAANLVDELLQKLLGLTLLHIRHPVTEAEKNRDPHLQSTNLLDEARILAKHLLDERGDPSFLAQVCQLQATVLMQQDQADRAKEELVQAVQFFVEKSKHFQSAIASVQVGLCELQLWKKHPANSEHFDAAWNRFNVAIDMFEILGAFDPAASAQFYIAHAWELARSHFFPGPDRDKVSMNCLESLKKAEMLRGRIRLDLSVLSGPEAIRRKQLFSASEINQKVFHTALLVTYQQRMYSAAWDWIQMFKARSLSDLLGIGCLIPEHLSEQFRDNEELTQLLAEESELVQRIERQPPDARWQQRIELDNLRKKMRNFPSLSELLDLRAGRSEMISDLTWLFQSASQNIVLIDWICVGDDVYIVILDHKLQPSMERLPFSVMWLKEWVKKHIPESFRKPEKDSPLRELDNLILPLSFVNQSGSVLILSPSGPLHSIPLHALKLPSSRTLIEEYPVVYAPSLSILHLCVLRTLGPRTTQISMASFGAYEEPSFDNASLKVVQSSLSEYTELFGGESMYLEEVTKLRFSSRAIKAGMIHFHGHTRGSDDNILDRGIEVYSEEKTTIATDLSRTLRSGAEKWKDGGMLHSLETYIESPKSFGRRRKIRQRTPDRDRLGDDSDNDAFEDDDTIEQSTPHVIITVRDIFGIKLQAPVVSLIACQSALDEISTGDEPLGLVSAFLYAGATSVVGTLWPIRSADGRDFSKEFYDHVHSQSRRVGINEETNSATSFVDLAQSLQKAVVRIRERPGLGDPFNWAAFVLYGAWVVQPF